MNKKQTKTFILKLSNKNSVTDFEKFKNWAIFTGLKPGQLFEQIMSKYIFHQRKEKRNVSGIEEPILMGEVEFVDRLRKLGYATTKVTLKKWRDTGVLIDESGKPFWGTDGYSIVYDLKPMLKFIRNRYSKKRSIKVNGKQ